MTQPTDIAAITRAAQRLPSRRRLTLGGFFARYGVVAVLLGLIVVFCVHPSSRDAFPTWENAKTMIGLSGPLAVVALSLTLVLVMRDFDLSIGATIGLGGATAVTLMSVNGIAWGWAIVVGLLVGVLVGAVNGFLIAYLNAPSFVITLAITTVVTGVEFAITGKRTLFEGVAPQYEWIGQSRPLLDIAAQAWLAGALALALWLLLDHTEVGRYMYAVGGNPEAARLAGIRTRQLKLLGFIAVGLGSAFGGIILTSQAAASSPTQGAAYLLPAYAAAFLGSTMFRPGEFNIPGTIVGVLFLQVLQTGLTMLGLDSSVVNIFQGSILIAAVLASLIGRRGT